MQPIPRDIVPELSSETTEGVNAMAWTLQIDKIWGPLDSFRGLFILRPVTVV
jgi:hypothetical protein